MQPRLAAAMITDIGRELGRCVDDLDAAQLRAAEQYVAEAKSGCEDWTLFDADLIRNLLTRIDALARDPHFPPHQYERVRALIDDHIEQCAQQHARICRANGRV